MQTFAVIFIVAACAGWLAVTAWRYLRPKPGGKACAGSCCDGGDKKPALDGPASVTPGPRTMMISSDDLRARLAARRK